MWAGGMLLQTVPKRTSAFWDVLGWMTDENASKSIRFCIKTHQCGQVKTFFFFKRKLKFGQK